MIKTTLTGSITIQFNLFDYEPCQRYFKALMTMIEHTSRQNMLEKQNARQKELEAIR
jgi:hypothetical protein